MAKDNAKEVSDGISKLVTELVGLRSDLTHIRDKVERIDTALYGNGKPGMVVRLDRVERVQGNLVKAMWIGFAASVAAIVKQTHSSLKGG